MSDGTTISYDTIGNPLTWRGGLSFTWQNGRQLSTAQKSGLSLSYQYNASGIRTEKTVNGVTTEYYLDGSSIVAEKTGTDVIWYLYDGMGLAGFELNGTSYYYVYNGQGDVIGILDSSGNRVVTYTYDSWGSPPVRHRLARLHRRAEEPHPLPRLLLRHRDRTVLSPIEILRSRCGTVFEWGCYYGRQPRYDDV